MNVRGRFFLFSDDHHIFCQDKVGLTGVDVMPAMGVGMPAGAPAAATAVAATPAVEAKPEKENFDVKLVSFGSADNKIKVIKEVRAITGLGLKEVHL